MLPKLKNEKNNKSFVVSKGLTFATIYNMKFLKNYAGN